MRRFPRFEYERPYFVRAYRQKVVSFLSFHEHTAQTYNRQTGREQNVTKKKQRIHTRRRHRPCVTRPSALCCCGCCSCAYRSLRSVTHHLPISAAAVCDRPTHKVDGDVRTVWMKHVYLSCPPFSDVFLCFLAEAPPRNLGTRQLANIPNNVTAPPSNSGSGPHHSRLAGPYVV